VLGVEDPNLLREIHGKDENFFGKKPKSEPFERLESENCEGFGQNYESKFSVLKVS